MVYHIYKQINKEGDQVKIKTIKISVQRNPLGLEYPVIDFEVRLGSARFIGLLLWVDVVSRRASPNESISLSERDVILCRVRGESKGVSLDELKEIVNSEPEDDRIVCFIGYQSPGDSYPTFRLFVKESTAVVSDCEIKGEDPDGTLTMQSFRGYDRVSVFVCDDKMNKIDGTPVIKGW